MEGWIHDNDSPPGAGWPCHLSPGVALRGLTTGRFHLALVSFGLLRPDALAWHLAPQALGPGYPTPTPRRHEASGGY